VRQSGLFDGEDALSPVLTLHTNPEGDPALSGVEAGRQARDEAIQAVDDAAPVEFKDAALDAIRELARESERFTSDDVWPRIPEDVRPPEPRALGAVMVQAQRLGIVRPTKDFRVSNRPQCHANPKRIWERAA
jgi:hypothetical protein